MKKQFAFLYGNGIFSVAVIVISVLSACQYHHNVKNFTFDIHQGVFLYGMIVALPQKPCQRDRIATYFAFHRH